MPAAAGGGPLWEQVHTELSAAITLYWAMAVQFWLHQRLLGLVQLEEGMASKRLHLLPAAPPGAYPRISAAQFGRSVDAYDRSASQLSSALRSHA
jgi:hypothetical protein